MPLLQIGSSGWDDSSSGLMFLASDDVDCVETTIALLVVWPGYPVPSNIAAKLGSVVTTTGMDWQLWIKSLLKYFLFSVHV